MLDSMAEVKLCELHDELETVWEHTLNHHHLAYHKQQVELLILCGLFLCIFEKLMFCLLWKICWKSDSYIDPKANHAEQGERKESEKKD